MSYQTLRVSNFGCFELRDIRYSAGFIAPEHTHAECCFQIVLQGSFAERSADRADAYPAGSLIFRPEGFFHENPSFETPTRNLCVRLDNAEFPSHFSALAERRKIVLVRSPEVFAIGQRICKEMRNLDDLTPLLVEAACIEALGLLTREARQPVECGSSNLVSKAEALMQARLYSSLQLQDIAQELSVTRYVLADAFQAQRGCSLGAYVRDLRLQAARRLLEETNRSIGDIAYETGFADQSHLTRCFRRHFGITPARFRSAE